MWGHHPDNKVCDLTGRSFSANNPSNQWERNDTTNSHSVFFVPSVVVVMKITLHTWLSHSSQWKNYLYSLIFLRDLQNHLSLTDSQPFSQCLPSWLAHDSTSWQNHYCHTSTEVTALRQKDCYHSWSISSTGMSRPRADAYLLKLKQWETKVRLDAISQTPSGFSWKHSLTACHSIHALDFFRFDFGSQSHALPPMRKHSDNAWSQEGVVIIQLGALIWS